MPKVRAGEVQLGWREWGEGDVTVVFIHDGRCHAGLPARDHPRRRHSMNLESPALYAGYFGAWFGGLSSGPSLISDGQW
jgi:hypothetical protein